MGRRLILDTSVLLALYFGEPQASWALDHMQKSRGLLSMSTVNLTETLIRLRDRQPVRFVELERQLLNSGIRFVPPDIEQARIAAEARLRFPLDLGDCFVYALARIESQAILTLDSDFRCLDVAVITP